MKAASHNINKTSEDEQAKVLSIIKSCIASAKENLTMDQLDRDYKQLVGSPIPYRKFQHGTLASFLQSVPQVIKVINRGGILHVKSVPNEQTIHIENLVRGQKKSKSKGSFSKAPMRRPQRSWMPPQPSFQRPALLPTPMFPMHPTIPNQSLPFRQPSRPPQNFRVSNNLYIPMATVNGQKPPVEKISLPKPRLPIPDRPTTNPNTNSFKSILEREAKKKGLTNLKINTMRCGKKSTYFISTLNIGDNTFSSYPTELKTPKEAEEEVSRKALDFIKEMFKSTTLAETQSFELASQRIRQILENSPTGESIWWEDIRKSYEKEYQETVHFNWVKEANDRGVEEITFTKPSEKLWILSLNRNTSPSLKANGVNSPKSPSQPEEQNKLMQPPPLKLPEDSMWSVFVSYFKDCSEVWFRLIGEKYSDAYENLVTDMELHYMEKRNLVPVTDLAIDSYYVCSHEESWFRVRLVSIQNETVTVFFIDHGDNETVPTSKLFHLDPKFLNLPCQSINSCLAGFECGVSDPILLTSAQNLAMGKTLVAEVLSRAETISVVLYDTTTNEDVNINERLLQLLPRAYPVPNFPPEGGVCEVYVTNVTSGGDIYVKIESASFKVLESLLITARKRAAEILGDSENVSIDMGKLYLAKFSPDGEWQRAAPRSANRDPDGKSLLCRLHNVPSNPGYQWTQKATERLASLFPRKDEPLLLKVIKEEKEKPTTVELFQRVQAQNLLVSINATLDMDSSLFSNEDKNNNLKCDETVGAVQNPSPSRSKEEKVEPVSSSLMGEALALQPLAAPPFPEVNTFFDVFVTYAASPSHFAVQSWKNTAKLELLMGEMKSFYSRSSNLKSVGKIHQGGFYSLLHTDDSWYRVRIDQVSNEDVSGVFVDFGDCFCSTIDKVQPLWPNFKHLTYQAFKAKLGGILPNNIDWTPEDSCRFRQLVEDRAFVSIVTQAVIANHQNPPTLVLRLIDTKDPNMDVYIEEILIKEGRARRCSEETEVFPL